MIFDSSQHKELLSQIEAAKEEEVAAIKAMQLYAQGAWAGDHPARMLDEAMGKKMKLLKQLQEANVSK